MNIVAYVHGERYLTFLEPFLHSVLQVASGAQLHVYYDQISDSSLAVFRFLFPEVIFRSSQQCLYNDLDQKIPFKIVVLADAMSTLPEDSPVAFIDCDTIVVQDFSRYFDEDFDLAFTWKSPPNPINTGVMLFRNRPRVRSFLEEYARRIVVTLGDVQAIERAKQRAGAVDQAVIMDFIGEPPYAGARDVRLPSGERLRVLGYPCAELNQTECGPVTEKTHIIHYKSGWHPILLENAPFSAYRPASKCAEMHEVWQNVQRDVSMSRLPAAISAANGRFAAGFVSGGKYQETGVALNPALMEFAALCWALGITDIADVGFHDHQATAALTNLVANAGVRVVSVPRTSDLNMDTLASGRSSMNASMAVLIDGSAGLSAVQQVVQIARSNPHLHLITVRLAEADSDIRAWVLRCFKRVRFADDGSLLTVLLHPRDWERRDLAATIKNWIMAGRTYLSVGASALRTRLA